MHNNCSWWIYGTKYCKLCICIPPCLSFAALYILSLFFSFLVCLAIGSHLLTRFISVFFEVPYNYSKPMDFFKFTFFPAFFEELIFRESFFYYSKKISVSHLYILNIILFSFTHIIPTPSIILLGVLLTILYKKYNSFFINFLFHFFYNLFIIFISLKLR